MKQSNGHKHRHIKTQYADPIYPDPVYLSAIALLLHDELVRLRHLARSVANPPPCSLRRQSATAAHALPIPPSPSPTPCLALPIETADETPRPPPRSPPPPPAKPGFYTSSDPENLQATFDSSHSLLRHRRRQGPPDIVFVQTERERL
ncbi:hypothetical protein ACLB2K_050912 [Fragaria x ananassa]